MGDKHSPSVRAFALSLHCTSPKAYDYVREKFGRNLPHPETIREWFRRSDLGGSSGISQHSLNALEKKSKEMEKQGQQLVVCLLMDEMAIKRHTSYCRATSDIIGLVDYGEVKNENDDDFILAENVIVFMICGVNTYFQQPLAYYFIKSLKGKEKVELILAILKELSNRKIKLSNLTFDGYSSNASMCDILGTNLNTNDGNYETSFKNPFDKQDQVYVMYDPSHMEKLVRTTLGSLGTFYYGKQKIEWKYFEKLVEVSRQNNFDLTHKMNKRHIDYPRRKMHVRTAVETLSASVANSMEFLMSNGNINFANASPTIYFVRIFNDLWDIMNTHRVRHDLQNKFKSALNPANKAEVFVFLHKAKEYILSLKIIQPKSKKRVLIVNSRLKTGFRGFVINIISLIAMYRDFVENHHFLLFFATYRISQDHLEMFFGKIRAMCGNNDNPMPFQFNSLFRKCLHQCEITHSPYSNVSAQAGCNVTSLITSNILTIPSTRKLRSILNEDTSDQLEERSKSHTPEEILDLENIIQSQFLTDNIEDAGIAYLANTIESRLTNCDQIHCETCHNVLLENEKLDSKLCVSIDRGKPCISTYQICKMTDKVLKFYINRGPNIKGKVIVEVMNNLNWEDIFPIFYYEEHDFEHKHFIVKFIIDEYVNKKCAHIAKQKMLELEKKYIRNKYKKMCHNYHQ